jgi:hypothetical protein
MALRIALYVIAALLLAAHFLRQGDIAAVVLSLCSPLLFLRRKRWTLLVLQLLAYGAAASWVVLAVRLAQLRQQSGQSWTLAVIILGAVALVTLLAGLLLNSRALRERYPL